MFLISLPAGFEQLTQLRSFSKFPRESDSKYLTELQQAAEDLSSCDDYFQLLTKQLLSVGTRTEPSSDPWFKSDSADWFSGQPPNNALEKDIAEWFRAKPASMAPDGAMAGWCSGQPATSATDAEIADWVKQQPPPPPIEEPVGFDLKGDFGQFFNDVWKDERNAGTPLLPGLYNTESCHRSVHPVSLAACALYLSLTFSLFSVYFSLN